MAWVWICRRDNNASRPSIDGVRCTSESRKTYKTEKLAQKAADRHQCKIGWGVGGVRVIDIGRTRWKTKK
jgi:hypothetical protein